MRTILITLVALTISACAHDYRGYGGNDGGKAGGDTVVVCHKGKKTLELPREAEKAHINHGDTYGSCYR